MTKELIYSYSQAESGKDFRRQKLDLELNLREIGVVLGVTESRVSQIHGQGMKKLRSRMAGWKEAV